MEDKVTLDNVQMPTSNLIHSPLNYRSIYDVNTGCQGLFWMLGDKTINVSPYFPLWNIRHFVTNAYGSE